MRAGNRRRALWLVGAYGGIATLGAVALVLVLPRGTDMELPAALPAAATVEGPPASCLGSDLAVVQSGEFVDLFSRANGTAQGRLGRGRIDRSTDQALLAGTCAATAAEPGGDYEAFLVPRPGTGEWEGTIAVGGTRQDLRLRPAAAETVPVAGPSESGTERLANILLAVSVVIVASRLVGVLFARLGQPRVAGEIVAGIMLGPSLLGTLLPGVTESLFSSEVLDVLGVLAQFGLVFFMFLIGLELDWTLVGRSGHAAISISHASIVAPFTLGLVAALFLYPLVGAGPFVGFALFLGAAMAITAFPVLARILTETGLYRTRVGSLAITCAAVDDVTAWCILSVVVAVVRADGLVGAAQTVALALVFVALMLLVVRPLAAKVVAVSDRPGRLSAPAMGAILVGLFLSAWATEWIGIHAIFGAFMAGAILPRSHSLVAEITSRIEDLTVLFLLPMFFAVVGLSTQIGLLNQWTLWQIAGAVLVLAMVGKLGGTLLAARVAGEAWRRSVALGVLMNTRGLTEIVILTVGRGLGVVSPALFTIMVLMALTTTFMATPLLRRIYPRRLIERELARADAAALRARWRSAASYRVMVEVKAVDRAGPLLGIAEAMVSPSGHQPEVVLVGVAPPPGREEVRANLMALEDAARAARRQLARLAEDLLTHGIDTRVRVTVGVDRAGDLARLAAEEAVDFLLLSAHAPYLGRNELGGPVGESLDQVVCTAAVLVDGDRLSPLTGPVAFLQTGIPSDDQAAFHVAARLARGFRTSLRAVTGPTATLPPVEVPVERTAVAAHDRESLLELLRSCSVAVRGRERGKAMSTESERALASARVPVLLVQGSARGVRAASPLENEVVGR